MTTLSIIILTYNQKDLTLRCLRSLRDGISDVSAEIIIVDNGSTDGTRKKIEKEFPDVVYIRNDKNLGVAAGRNIGIDASHGDFIMILDNDTLVPGGALQALVEYLDSHPDVGLVAPRLTNMEGKTQKSCKEYPGLGVKISNVFSRGRSDHFLVATSTADQEPFYVIGAAQLFRREVWNQAGRLDEKIFYGPEDADFCIRVRNQGWKVVYHPAITIIHDWQRSTTTNLMSPMARKHIRSLFYFYWKWKRWL